MLPVLRVVFAKHVEADLVAQANADTVREQALVLLQDALQKAGTHAGSPLDFQWNDTRCRFLSPRFILNRTPKNIESDFVRLLVVEAAVLELFTEKLQVVVTT